MECAAGEGWEEEGRRVEPLEEGGIVPMGYFKGFVCDQSFLLQIVIVRLCQSKKLFQ